MRERFAIASVCRLMSVMGGLRRVLWTVALVSASSVWGQTQSPPAEDLCQLVKDPYGNLTMDPRCPNPPGAKQTPAAPAPDAAPATPAAPAAKRFPFPGEDTVPASAPASPGQPVPQTPPSAVPGAPAGKRFPYPGETDPAAPDGTPAGAAKPSAPVAGQPPLNDAGSSGQSSSSSSSSSGSSEGDAAGSSSSSDHAPGDNTSKDPDAAPPPHHTRRKLPPVPRQSPSEREQEDVQVAGFYINDGNLKGAYERAKDAVTLDTTDPSAHLALAESARKLGKLDEAEAEYKQCLVLDPVPKDRKVAERALREMTGGG